MPGRIGELVARPFPQACGGGQIELLGEVTVEESLRDSLLQFVVMFRQMFHRSIWPTTFFQNVSAVCQRVNLKGSQRMQQTAVVEHKGNATHLPADWTLRADLCMSSSVQPPVKAASMRRSRESWR